MKRALVAVLAFFILIEAVGCKVTNKTSTIDTFKINRRAKIGDLVIYVNSVRINAIDVVDPMPGYIYYIVDITIGNKGKSTVEICPLVMFRLYDSQNFKYNITFAPKTKENLSGSLMPKSKIRGEIAFEIPSDSVGLYLIFEPVLIVDGKATIYLN